MLGQLICISEKKIRSKRYTLNVRHHTSYIHILKSSSTIVIKYDYFLVFGFFI